MNDLALDAASSHATLSHEDRELAVTYGIEARRHHAERAWTHKPPERAAGGARWRGFGRAVGPAVVAHVEAAWNGAIRL